MTRPSQPEPRASTSTDVASEGGAQSRARPASKPPERRGLDAELGAGKHVGRYVVLHRLGRGGMGVVYAAYDPKLDRKIAIKVMRRRSGTDPELAQDRMLREAQSLAKLSHPNVVAVHDTGLIDGQVFVAMDCLQGDDVRRWLRALPRSRQAIIDALAQAGEGLAAAHAAGIVHRDFKPDNVLVGVDGRVQVLDFGLARVADPTAEEQTYVRRARERRSHEAGVPRARSRPPSSASMRRAELRPPAGTPAYMAPEQHARGLIDAKADQFAFCVTLYEALCGRPPHATGGTGLKHAIVHGEIREPPRHSPLPRALRKVIWRGLSTDPADRYPSMKALLADLRRPRGRKRRIAAVLATTAAVAGMVGLASVQTGSDADPCGGANTRLESVWGQVQRTQVRSAFVASNRPDAAHSFDATAKSLDAYAAAWVGTYAEACRATHVRHEQSDAMLDLRMECLRSHKDRLRALVEALTAADGPTIARAPMAAAALEPLAPCADADALRERMPLPGDAAALAEITELRRRIAQATALQHTGRPDAARALLESVTARAATLAWEPLTAEVHYELGRTLESVGRWSDAESNLVTAAVAAEVAHDDHLLARIRTLLVLVVGDRDGRPREGHLWARLAQAAIARAGEDPRLASKLETNLAHVLDREAKPEEVLAHHERALTLLKQAPVPPVLLLAAAHGNLAASLTGVGRRDEALAHARRAQSLWTDALGPDHLHAATAVAVLAYVLDDMGRTAEAIAQYRLATEIAERALGPDSPVMAEHLANLAVARAQAGELTGAIEDFRRIVQIYIAAHGPRHADVASATYNLASALGLAERRDEALAHHKRALALRESLFGKDHLQVTGSLDGVANQLEHLGKPAEALPYRIRGLEIRERVFGIEHPELVHALGNLAHNLLAVDQVPRALRTAERALRLASAPSLRPQDRAYCRIVLAKILAQRPQQGARAHALLQTAVVELGDAPAVAIRRVLAEARAALAQAGWEPGGGVAPAAPQ